MSRVRPFTITDRLDGSMAPDARLVELLRAAKAWLDETDLPRLLDVLLADQPACRALFTDGDRIDHVGFLLPVWAKPLLSGAANAAGFPLAHRAFPSGLLARELGRILGQRRLATQIFKAYGRTAGGASAAFEAFIPAIEDARAEDWIRKGVGNHVAITLASPERFALIRSAFAAAGLRMAGFMYDRAVFLPGEDATILYFDLDRSEHPFRVEVRAPGDLAEHD